MTEADHALHTVTLTINGARKTVAVEPRRLLVHLIREDLGLTGTHIGCDTSQCGACTVDIDGQAVKSCTVLAVMADGSSITTIEGLAPKGGALRGTAADRRSVCTPDLTVIETLDGRRLDERRNPRAAFEGHTPATPWDEINLAYFSGYAIWNYLTTPFLFALPGITTEEIEPRSNGGAMHRRLKVTFPDSIATHGPEQVFHVGEDNLISRVDYSAVVVGNLPTAHVMTDYRDFDGIKIATRRRAYRRNPDGTADPSLVAVAIDIAGLRLS